MGAPHAMTTARALACSIALVAATACTTRELPPLGEVVVVVDTDLPVPRVVSALRVDTYANDGTWLESRDIALRDPRDWPASFSVQAADDARDRDVVIRVRVHGQRMRDVVSGPRLVVGGADVTPLSEPEPALTVDRLLLVRLRPGERGRAQVVARAACAAIPARLDGAALATCDDGALAPAQLVTLEPELSTPSTSVVGTAERSACKTTVASDRACVEGGAFV
ncbi:MAG: Adenylate cyclase, partial [Labilithrix sp.]|nr:Adenylate cyclase [Labilithrix sp.]